MSLDVNIHMSASDINCPMGIKFSSFVMGSNMDYWQSLGSRSHTLIHTPEITILGGAGQI